MPPLCTFAVLPAARKIFSTSVAVHILCAASTQHRRYHGIQFRWSLLLCTSSVLPARQAHQTFFSICSRSAVHILCAASTHHGRIRSMLLSLYVECICCAHSLCCQQRAKSSARRWLCTFSALPAHSTAGTMAYNSAGRCCCAHPLCCQQDRLTRHFSQYAVDLLCTFSALPAHITAAFVACC